MGQKQTTLQQSQEAVSRYQYRPLTVDAFRLIRLHKSRKFGLHCTIQHASIESPSAYTALSYAWGINALVHEISVVDVDGVHEGIVPLTQNLYFALDDLWNAPQVRPKLFFIDQISINQDDVQERGSQVALMGKIYKTASQVITHLGPRTEHDMQALQLMKKVEAHFQKQFKLKLKGSDLHREVLEEQASVSRHIPNPSTYRTLLLNGHPGQDMIRELELPDVGADHPGWQMALEMSASSCCRRLWMIQENILNDNIHMLRGPFLIEWNLIAAFASLITTHPTFVHNQPIDEYFQALRLLDPRDRVYACLGIARDGECLGIKPDYTISEPDLYVEVARTTLEYHQNLKCLDFVVEPDHEQFYPKWAPHKWGRVSESRTRRFAYSLGDNWCAFGEISGRVRVKDKVLAVNGVFADTIGSLQIDVTIRDKNFYDSLFHSTDIRCKMLLKSGQYTTADLQQRYVKLIELQVSRIQQLRGNIEEMVIWAKQSGMDEITSAMAAYSALSMLDIYPEDCSNETGLRAVIQVLTAFETQLTDLVDHVTQHTALLSDSRKPFKLSTPTGTHEELSLAATVFSNDLGLVSRTIFFTKNGRFGSLVGKVQEGDQIALLSGGSAIYVLRPSGTDFKFVGSGFVVGLMHGQARLDPAFEQKIRPIKIV